MQNIKLRSHIGPDGILHLQIPVGMAEAEVDVTVLVQPVSHDHEPHTPEELEEQFEMGEELL